MPGMNSGLNSNNATLVAAFRSALLHQGLWVLLIFAMLAVAWIAVREWLRPPRPRAGRARARLAAVAADRLRRHLDLRRAAAGPARHAGRAARRRSSSPAASSSPGWVQDIVNWAGTSWSYHPIEAAAATVWIQIGIGAWLIAAPRGPWSRLAGMASVAWGLVVWVFGEAFGRDLRARPDLAVRRARRGAVLLRGRAADRPARAPLAAAAGPDGPGRARACSSSAWPCCRPGPGAGFWQGTLHGKPGTLTGMVSDMASTPQPALLAGWARDFGSFTAAHGFAVNLFTVIALAVLGAGLVNADRGPGLADPGHGHRHGACSAWPTGC